jgi:hypothetical protein
VFAASCLRLPLEALASLLMPLLLVFTLKRSRMLASNSDSMKLGGELLLVSVVAPEVSLVAFVLGDSWGACSDSPHGTSSASATFISDRT